MVSTYLFVYKFCTCSIYTEIYIIYGSIKIFTNVVNSIFILQHINFLNYINAERKCMMFGGYYPAKETKSKILHYLSAVSFMAIVTLYNLLGLIHGFQHVSNVTVFSELIAFLLTGISYTCKIVNVVFHKRNFELLDELLQNPVVTELESEEEELLVKDKLRFGQKLKKVYRVYVATTIITQMLYPLINNAGQKNFPILLWFPFNAEDHYYKIYGLEVLMIISCCFFNVTVDLLTVLFMDLCAVQFELLKHRLMLVGSPLSVEQEIDEELTFQKLRKIIVHQNYVYRYYFGRYRQLFLAVFIRNPLYSLLYFSFGFIHPHAQN